MAAGSKNYPTTSNRVREVEKIAHGADLGHNGGRLNVFLDLGRGTRPPRAGGAAKGGARGIADYAIFRFRSLIIFIERVIPRRQG